MSDQIQNEVVKTDAVSTVTLPKTGTQPVQGKATTNVQLSQKPPVPVAKPAAPVPAKINVSGAVAAQSGAGAQRPPSMRSGNTSNLTDQTFFRCVLYSETSARKTVTAAKFAGPEFTRIILTRNEDQLIPLDGLGYQYEYCPDPAALTYALKYPEKVWPDWAAMADPEKKRTLVVDDLTKAAQILVDANSGSKDRRQSYTGALDDLDGMLVPLTRKPYNMIWITLARVSENKFSGEEQINPDLSPSMKNYVTAEFAAVLYIKTKNYTLLTDRDNFSVEGIDDKGKTITYTREIFGKVKVPLLMLEKGIIRKEEPLDLNLLWSKIRSARTAAKNQGVKGK